MSPWRNPNAWFSNINSAPSRYLLIVLVLGVFLTGSAAVFSRTIYNWDMLGYVGLIKQQTFIDASEIHRTTYETVREVVSDQDFEELISGVGSKELISGVGSKYRQTAYEDPSSFVQQLAWYRGRVAYWGLGYLLSKAGIHEVTALRIIGAAFYFALCTVVLFHLTYLFPDQTLPLLLSVVVAIYPPLLQMGTVMNPDMMASVGVALGFSLLLREKLILGTLIMVATVFVRTDIVVFCALLITPVVLVGRGPLARRIGSAIGLALAVPLVLLINSAFDYPGWEKLFTTSFVEILSYPLATDVSVSLEEYFRVLLSIGLRLLIGHPIWLIMVLSIVFFCKVFNDSRLHDPALVWLGAILTYLPVRMILYPSPADRFFIVHALLVFFLLAGLFQRRESIDLPFGQTAES